MRDDANDADDEDLRRRRNRAVARFLLGNMQMFTAAFAIVLLVRSRLGDLTLAAFGAACLLTLASRFLFPRDKKNTDDPPLTPPAGGVS